jgi:hypothetical protein
MKFRAFWQYIALMMEVVRTCETSVYSNDTTRRYISEDSILLIVNNVCAKETELT